METSNKTILSAGNGVLKSRKSIAEDSLMNHGSEVTELISSKPPFWVRWGTFLFFFLLVLIGLVSWFIEYPDIVTASGTLNSVNAPKGVNAFSGGKLVKLFVKENQPVKTGEILGYIESTADHYEVIVLSEMIDSNSLKDGKAN